MPMWCLGGLHCLPHVPASRGWDMRQQPQLNYNSLTHAAGTGIASAENAGPPSSLPLLLFNPVPKLAAAAASPYPNDGQGCMASLTDKCHHPVHAPDPCPLYTACMLRPLTPQHTLGQPTAHLPRRSASRPSSWTAGSKSSTRLTWPPACRTQTCFDIC